MPWTPSHAAAVLPLQRLCPRYLHFPALVAGSMAPDLGYYVGQFDLSEYAHNTLPGSVVVSLPLGLACLLIFYALRRPLWFLLPQPHRSALEPLLGHAPRLNARTLLTIAISVVLGAWTHVVWDLFTHSKTWIVERVPVIAEPWIAVGEIQVHGFTVLQDLSTLIGAALLGAAYFAWLRKQSPSLREEHHSDRWRYATLLGIAAASTFIALSMAFDATAAVQVPMRVVVVQAAFYAGTVFASLLIVYSAFYFVLRSKIR